MSGSLYDLIFFKNLYSYFLNIYFFLVSCQMQHFHVALSFYIQYLYFISALFQ